MARMAVVMPAWLRLVADSGEAGCARVAQLAVNVFGVSADMADLKLVAYEGIARFRHWLNALGMPSTLTQMGLKESDIQTLVRKMASAKPSGRNSPIPKKISLSPVIHTMTRDN